MTLKQTNRLFTIEIPVAELYTLISALEDRVGKAKEYYALEDNYDEMEYWKEARDEASELLDTLMSWL